MKPTAINEGGFQFTENGNSAPETNSFLSFHQANREVLRITHEGRMICGEWLSTEEATQQAAKLLIQAFEQEIKKMLDARAAAELVTMNVPRREKAEADTARLDWLDENVTHIGGGRGGRYTFFTPADCELGMLRDAIDAAMKEASK
jgi:hypothetical protein